MKKTNTLNIIIIVVVLALVAVLVWNNKKDQNKEVKPTDDNSVVDDSTTNNSSTSMEELSEEDISTPAGSWEAQSINGEITFDIPANYYVSHPVIGECKDVTSISTQTPNIPTISVAFVYKAGCVKDNDVLANFTKQEFKKGYVFQTSSGSPAVLSVFSKIVASAR